ncbi:MAG: RNA polymerase factor sigma-54 [Alphaproteobacteria bacterium]|nr:RNA polymerase factor sigma-54 [Alphaproteobacteria bacterium]
MAIGPRLEFRQSQTLSLTPQLMQSIRLLQLSHLELNAFVEAELERNPLLERDETSETDTPEPAEERAAAGDGLDVYEQGESIGTAESMAEALDSEAADIFPEQVGAEPSAETGRMIYEGGPSGEQPDIDAFVASVKNLADHLHDQIVYLLREPADRLIATHLIENLDEAGYLIAGCDGIAETLGVDVARVEAVLEIIQTCEPTGVFARNLAECLALQLRERDRLDPFMQRLLAHLDLVASHDLATLMRVVECDREDLSDMLAELRELDPRPGRAFDGAPVQTIVPDVFVRPGPDGGWALELNSEVLPRVLVNRTYYASVVKKTHGAAEKGFLVDCLQTANWLTRSLDQRAQTILKVAAEIVRQQDAFLLHGISYLRPMTLKMVAEPIEMHESTVSRVTANKYLSTPRGLFEMKYFFTTALGSLSGAEDHSAAAVRHLIRQMIDAEDAKAILSDDTIAERLKNDRGIDVARRTVAKYREGMNIPSSVIRRRQKRAKLQLA